MGLVAAWPIGFLAAWFVVPLLGSVPSGAIALLSIGSGMVAVCSLVPGLATDWLAGRVLGGKGLAGQIAVSEGDVLRRASRITSGLSAAMLIRLAGTVALIGMCSYQMPAAKHEAAGVILAWYLYLTATEVSIIASRLPRLDARPRSDSGVAVLMGNSPNKEVI